MSPDRKVFSSSLYPERELEIDGKTYKVRRMNLQLWRELIPLLPENPTDAEKMENSATIVANLIQAPIEDVAKWPSEMVKDIMNYLNSVMGPAKKSETEEKAEDQEKKEPGPGETPSLS